MRARVVRQIMAWGPAEVGMTIGVETYMDQSSSQNDQSPLGDRKERKADPKFIKYLKAVVSLDASDLHMKAGSVARVRVTGRVRPTKGEKLSDEAITSMVMPMLNEEQKQHLKKHGAVDLAYELEGSDRFRISIFRQRGRLSLAARRVPRVIPEFADLHLPDIVRSITENPL